MQRKQPRYEDGKEYWECPACRLWQVRGNYYHSKRTWNGITSQCKKCHTAGSVKTRDPDNARRTNREYMARARRINPDKFKERDKNRPPASPEKVLARSRLNSAVKNGGLSKPKQCSKCGSEMRINGHHSDYNKPLEVEWLCPLCHAETHR